MRITLVTVVAMILIAAAPAHVPEPAREPVAGNSCANICDHCWLNEYKAWQHLQGTDPWDWNNHPDCAPMGDGCESCDDRLAAADGLSDDAVLSTIKFAFAGGPSVADYGWVSDLGERLLLNPAQGTIAVKGGCSGHSIIALVRGSAEVMVELQMRGVMALGAATEQRMFGE